MIINVSDILKQHGSTKEVVYKQKFNKLNFSGQFISFNEPVEINGIIRNNGKVLSFDGNLNTTFSVKCDKCLKDFNYNYNIDFSEKFSYDGNLDDVNILNGDVISVEDVATDIILLNLPLSFVCNEDCKGLCTICGCNKNIEECDCNHDDIDPRLLKLKELLK